MVRHVDGLVQGREPELHVPLDEPHGLAGGAGCVAEGFGEAPANLKACELTKNTNHCTEQHADDEAFWEDVYYWTTPGRRLR